MPASDECNGVDRRTILEAVQASDVYLCKGLCPDVLKLHASGDDGREASGPPSKAAAGHRRRHGTSALHAARRSLAHARADAAADTLARST